MGRHGSPRNADGTLNTLPSPDSNSDPANSNDDHILPAFYAPTSIFPTSVTNKIDLSSSVSQYLKKKSDISVNDSTEKTDSYTTKSDNDLESDPHDGKRNWETNNNKNHSLYCQLAFINRLTFSDNDSTGSRSPIARTTSFYSRFVFIQHFTSFSKYLFPFHFFRCFCLLTADLFLKRVIQHHRHSMRNHHHP